MIKEKEMKKILFVCHGNICRSVMAETIFKFLDKDHQFYVESKATTRDSIGNDIYPPVKVVLKKNHIPYQKHSARQILPSDYEKFDFIFCMDQENLEDLKRSFPDFNKIFLLGEKEIVDPWYSRDFDLCFQEIYSACDHLIKRLRND